MSDDEIFQKLYEYHELVCGKFGMDNKVSVRDRWTLLGIVEKEEKMCYTNAIAKLAKILPRNFSL